MINGGWLQRALFGGREDQAWGRRERKMAREGEGERAEQRAERRWGLNPAFKAPIV